MTKKDQAQSVQFRLKIEEKNAVVTILNELIYQAEVKSLLSKIALGIKCLYNLRDCLLKSTSCFD